MAITLLNVRAELTVHLQTALDGLGWDQTPIAYAYPAESIAIPAVIVLPDSPYWAPARFTSGKPASSGVRVNLELQLIVPRTEVEEGVGDLEEMAVAVGVAIATSPVFRFVDMSQPEPIEVEGAPALLCRFAVVGIV